MSGPSVRSLLVLYLAVLAVAGGLELWRARTTVMTFVGIPTPLPESVRAAATATALEAAAQATATRADEARRDDARRLAEAARQATAAAQEAHRIEEERRLADARQREEESRRRQQEEAEVAQRRRQTFLREDFSRVPIGQVPHGWLGAENVICKEAGTREQKVLTTFQPGPVQLRIPDVKFPENFRLRWIISGDSECLHSPSAYVVLGGLEAGIKETSCGQEYWAFIGQSEVKVGGRIVTSAPMELVLEKRGPVFRLILDGREVVISRNPDRNPIDGMNLILWKYTDQAHVSLHLLEGMDLGPVEVAG